MSLRLAYSGTPTPGTVAPKHNRRSGVVEPPSNVANIRMRGHGPYDREADELTPTLVRTALSALISHGRRSDDPQLREAARVVETAARRDRAFVVVPGELDPGLPDTGGVPAPLFSGAIVAIAVGAVLLRVRRAR